MGVPNSATAANIQTVTNFFAAIGTHTTANVLALFSNDSAGPPPVPTVGITSHTPNFTYMADLTLLFNRLFTSFPDLTLTPYAGKPWLYSLDSYGGLPTIGVETDLAGSYQAPWFPKVAGTKDSISHYSKPLSDISPQQGNFQPTKIPAYCAFALNVANPNNPLISQLSIFMDRYRFEADLKPAVG
jgi:hypothetical protein